MREIFQVSFVSKDETEIMYMGTLYTSEEKAEQEAKTLLVEHGEEYWDYEINVLLLKEE